MSSANKVYQLGQDDFLEKSHKKLINQISVLDWEMQIQQIIKSVSLPLSDVLLNKSTQPAPNSHASKCGHSTVESFVTSPIASNGLDMDWNEWHSKVTAYSYKKAYNIYTDDPVEIIQEFKDISSFLGYKPANSEEYQESKDKIFKAQRSQVEKQHSLQVKEMQENISDLMRQANQSSELLQSAQDKIESLNQSLEAAQIDFEQQIQLANDNHKTDLARHLENQKLQVSKQFESKIIEIQTEADIVKAKSMKTVEEIEAKYNSDNFVSRVEFKALQQELNRERESTHTDLIKLNKLNDQLESLNVQLAEKDRIIFDLEGKISEQANAIASLTIKIEKGEIAGSDLTFEDYTNLQSELLKLESIAEDYKAQNALLEKKLGKTIKTARNNMLKLNKSLKKQKVKNKKQLGIIKIKQSTIGYLIGLCIMLMTGLSLAAI